MSLIEEYYELNEAEDVSGMWKVLILVFYVVAGCVGLWCGYTIAILRKKFQNKCYLFTEIKLPGSNQRLDMNNINWANDAMCDFAQYSMVSSIIVATIWATFFLMCGKGGRSLTGLPQPWRIVSPALLFNFLYFLLTLGVAINIQEGTDHFCGTKTLSSSRGKPIFHHCTIVDFLVKSDWHLTKFQLDTVAKTGWGCTASWFVLFLLAFLRIIFVADFQMYKICVFKIEETGKNEQEEILRITTYEEPKRLRGDDKMKKISFALDNPLPDEDSSRRDTTDKRSQRVNFNTITNFPMTPKTFFYVTADIRNLNRENKRKKVSKNLNEAFTDEMKNLYLDFRKNSNLEDPNLMHRFQIDSTTYSESGKSGSFSLTSKDSDSEQSNQDTTTSNYDQDSYLLVNKKYV